MCTDTAGETCRRAPGINSLYITLMTGQGSLTTHKSPAAGQHALGVDAIDLGHDSTWASVLPIACALSRSLVSLYHLPQPILSSVTHTFRSRVSPLVI